MRNGFSQCVFREGSHRGQSSRRREALTPEEFLGRDFQNSGASHHFWREAPGFIHDPLQFGGSFRRERHFAQPYSPGEPRWLPLSNELLGEYSVLDPVSVWDFGP